jgi:hypothetical protein
LVLIIRGSSNRSDDLQQDEWNKTDAFAERMMAMDGGQTMLEAPDLGPVNDSIATDTGEQMETFDAEQTIESYDFAEQLTVSSESLPPSSLMGMMDGQGREHIEYPAQSGKLWHRDTPDSPWMKN